MRLDFGDGNSIGCLGLAVILIVIVLVILGVAVNIDCYTYEHISDMPSRCFYLLK